jgi:CBS domain containing-hemolysin-like protein
MRCRSSPRELIARRTVALAAGLGLAALAAASPAHASIFSGDTLDFVADILAWIVLFIAPAVAIAVFWMVHILPERIAEERHHPQAHAIKTLCLLSLFFGGLLWPLAWLWAYSKPVLYKLAYGTDVVDPHEHKPPAPADTEEYSADESTLPRPQADARDHRTEEV